MSQTEFWPTYVVPQRIVFHADFDGICAAALMIRFFGNAPELEPVNYSIKNQWLRRELSNSAVVDFLYHPEAAWWFDHHVTSFVNDELKQKYAPDARHRWNVSYASCPSLILDVLSESVDTKDLRAAFGEWSTWSDIIDSARYSSPNEAVLGQQPCILINQALSQTSALDLRRKLVNMIVAGSKPAEIAQSQEIATLSEKFRQRQSSALKVMEKRLRVLGSVGLCDLLGTQATFIRYGVYLLAPHVAYSITAYNSHSGAKPYKISLSRNPWQLDSSNTVNLGELASRYGGGGRDSVGAISFESAQACSEVALAIAQQVAEGARVSYNNSR